MRRSPFWLFVVVVVLNCVAPSIVWAQANAFVPGLAIDQKALEEGKYPLGRVLEAGQQYFNVPFTPAGEHGEGDGLGEGRDGPRRFERHAFWPYPWPVNGTTLAARNRQLGDLYEFPFVKLNGLGATSCYDCHSSIGTWNPPGARTSAMVRKPGTPGGSGGFSTNAFINDEYPARSVKLIRNPPHVFGTGYTNRLATEMTLTLQAQAEAARLAAKNRPGELRTIALRSKGLTFGTFSTTFNGKTGEFDDDESHVTGVAADLVVRPFQWKGIASSVRHFVRDALDFHFSLQAEEKVAHVDCDMDGKIDEVTLGNVSALTAYVAMTRPPQQQIPRGKETAVRRGEAIFTGSAKDVVPTHSAMCASCHAPSMRVEQPVLTILTPPIPNITSEDQCPQEAASLIDPVATSNDLPSLRQFNMMFPQVLKNAAVKRALADPNSSPEEIYRAIAPVLASVNVRDLGKNSYQIDLSLAVSHEVPSYVYPRLAVNDDSSVDVPLYSDLRLHDMGEALQDPASQGSDVAGIAIPPPLFVTRVLWGVADSGPWMHDGRARTLREAILLHRSPGSEANEVIDVFSALPPSDQQAVIDFLLTLRLPVDIGITANESIPTYERSAQVRGGKS